MSRKLLSNWVYREKSGKRTGVRDQVTLTQARSGMWDEYGEDGR